MTIPHSRPFLPPIEMYQAHVRDIWNNAWLTNHGPKVVEFEREIAKYLGLEYVSYVNNGTSGLQFALKTLPKNSEVITTPYSYVATSSAIFWEGHTPVFVDIEPRSLALNPDLVAEKIGPDTRAILATHVYGIPVDIDSLRVVAKRHNLALLLDAAHCFGVKFKGQSILNYGDYSVLSLHATKLFHTANGGLVVSKTAEAKQRIDYFRNFGHNGPNHFECEGINGKNSEFNAAMGLANLGFADEILAVRVAQWQYYRTLLSDLGDDHFVEIPEHTMHNGAYFPVLNLRRHEADKVMENLMGKGIEGRRYFNPSLNTIPYMRGAACPISEKIADTVICLPLYHNLKHVEQELIVGIVLQALGYK